MRKAVTVLAAIVLSFATAAFEFGQVQAQTTKTAVVQNPDGTYSVIEVPTGKEISVTLIPTPPTAGTGVATILRDDNGTRIKLHVTGIPADMTSMTLYAVDDSGAITPIGPIAITNGVGELAATTPLSKFMLIASPEPALTAYDPTTKVYFRSTVPEGLAVIPRVVNPAGEKVSATTAEVPQVASTYAAPLLGIPMFKTGDDTKIKINLTGALTGSRANVFITPRKDGPTEVRMRFHELKDAPAGKVFILWAVGPDGKFEKLGQVVNTGQRNEAEIKGETSLPDFGLLITMEDASNVGVSPVGPRIGDFVIVR
jgi:hypothetical protein